MEKKQNKIVRKNNKVLTRKQQKKADKKINNEEGITLIALVVTIVILIILATVSINVVLGEGGLIQQAKLAKEMTTNSSIAEQEQLNEIFDWTTNSIEGSGELEPPIIEGEIIITPANWKGDGTASVTISSNKEEYIIEYRIDKAEGEDVSWSEIESGGIIDNLQHGDIIFTRLVNEGVYGDEASVNILDEISPSITNISTSNITQNSITVTVKANDEQSGLATSQTYKYYLNDEEIHREANITGSYIFTELKPETTYKIRVEVTDKAGNVVSKTTTATTINKLATNVDELKEGDYVYYIDDKGIKRTCVVLYDSSSNYGTEIVTMESVEDIVIGDNSDIEKCITSYNDTIRMLNSKSLEYNNQTYSSDSRAIGSKPDDKNYKSGYYSRSESWFSTYNNRLIDADTNYNTDMVQIQKLNIVDIGSEYWLASHLRDFDSTYTDFRVRFIRETSIVSEVVFRVRDTGEVNKYTFTKGLRPVFKLKSSIKITSGKGTVDSPYSLSA